MKILKKIFGFQKIEKKEEKDFYNSSELELITLEKFRVKNTNDKIKDIIVLGNSKNAKDFEIFNYVINYEDDKGVIMTALKRIHNFKQSNDISNPLKKLAKRKDIKEYEPYYSMALLNLDLISKEEFNKIFD